MTCIRSPTLSRAPACGMRSDRFRKSLWWSSLGIFGLVALNSAVALVSRWGVNAEALGAHHLGLAIFLAFGGAASMVISMYAAPFLVLLAGFVALTHRPAALWLLAAAAVSATPLAVVSLTGN